MYYKKCEDVKKWILKIKKYKFNASWYQKEDCGISLILDSYAAIVWAIGFLRDKRITLGWKICGGKQNKTIFSNYLQ